ncbi:chromosome partitioning protein [Paractinoplanes ferrugineus]|uniref:MinD/ParA family ATP-binding protein n=1 Tax=Paractinoplanes ferrugineus TaxID=113564 RepID=UPI003F68CF56
MEPFWAPDELEAPVHGGRPVPHEAPPAIPLPTPAQPGVYRPDRPIPTPPPPVRVPPPHATPTPLVHPTAPEQPATQQPPVQRPPTQAWPNLERHPADEAPPSPPHARPSQTSVGAEPTSGSGVHSSPDSPWSQPPQRPTEPPTQHSGPGRPGSGEHSGPAQQPSAPEKPGPLPPRRAAASVSIPSAGRPETSAPQPGPQAQHSHPPDSPPQQPGPAQPGPSQQPGPPSQNGQIYRPASPRNPQTPPPGPYPPTMDPRAAQPPHHPPATHPPASAAQDPRATHPHAPPTHGSATHSPTTHSPATQPHAPAPQQHPQTPGPPPQQPIPTQQNPTQPGPAPADPFQDLGWISDGTPTAEEFARRRLARPAEPVATMGARAVLRKGTANLIKLAPSKREQEFKQDVEKVRRNFGGLRQVTIVNPKGGAGKTVAVLLMAMTFGQKRGGYVLAWDNNETQGTLGMRAQQDFHARTVRDMMRDLHLFRGAHGRVGDLSQYVRAQGEGMFDVLASDESATAGEMLTAGAFAEIREIVSRFYKLIFVDTGNNVRAQNWQAAIDATDQLVITMSARNDSAETAARMLDHLEQSGRQRLVRQAISVVTMPPTRKDIDLPAIRNHFAARTREVLMAPYEKLIDSGEPLRYNQLSSNTKDAWLKIAAAVAEGL